THFPTRENLIVTVVESFGTDLMQRTHELATKSNGIRGVLAAHLACLQENEPFYARLISESATLPAAARHMLTGMQTAVSHHLFTAAQTEIANDTIRPIKMHLLFNTWIGLLHHYLLNKELFAPGGSVIEAKGGELLTHYLDLIKKE
ncbi:MAG: TetR/AcrR family transcriptional regulator, partial [Chloroflexi bacterium]|nr:TetR/AcrR family transcriptional regulator [Chloroflexota bacterium]